MGSTAFKSIVVLGLLALGGCGSRSNSTGMGGTGAGSAGTAGTGIAGTGGGAGIAGLGGTVATAGASGTGGGVGMAGSGGTAGATGTAGAAGTIGSAGASGCTITATPSLSAAIPTVGIVTFTTNITAITGAEIRFGLASTGPTMTAPVDLTQPDHRTLLLGMKGSSAYVFRIVVTSGAGTCTSEDYPLMTGAVPANVPRPTPTIVDAAAHARGFIVTTNMSGSSLAYIIDTDGAPVWWAPFRGLPTRAHMSWDGRDMYVVSGNSAGTNSGNVARISMDGSDVESSLPGFGGAHHDLTAVPGGVAILLWKNPGVNTRSSVVERSMDGTLKTVVDDLASVYNAPSGGVDVFHPNAIHYYPWDGSYTIGDRYANMFVKLTREGTLVWQFGGSNPVDPAKFFQGVPTWTISHGHHLLPDGTFVFFNNTSSQNNAIVRVFQLDTLNMTAASVLSYQVSGVGGTILGDAQRLPNGNILATYTESRQIHEISPSGRLVAKFESPNTLGYAEFRESLYGPPPY